MTQKNDTKSASHRNFPTAKLSTPKYAYDEKFVRQKVSRHKIDMAKSPTAKCPIGEKSYGENLVHGFETLSPHPTITKTGQSTFQL